jgi:hypothetical protein
VKAIMDAAGVILISAMFYSVGYGKVHSGVASKSNIGW